MFLNPWLSVMLLPKAVTLENRRKSDIINISTEHNEVKVFESVAVGAYSIRFFAIVNGGESVFRVEIFLIVNAAAIEFSLKNMRLGFSFCCFSCYLVFYSFFYCFSCLMQQIFQSKYTTFAAVGFTLRIYGITIM